MLLSSSSAGECAATVWSTNIAHTAPYVYDMQAVWRTRSYGFIIDVPYVQVQVNFVQALDLLGHVMLDWTNTFRDEPLTAKQPSMGHGRGPDGWPVR